MSTFFIPFTTWKDVGLSVSIAHPGSLEERSIGVKRQRPCILNTAWLSMKMWMGSWGLLGKRSSNLTTSVRPDRKSVV